MSFCPKCGKEIGDWVFCNKCGTNINEYLSSEAAKAAEPSEEKETVESTVSTTAESNESEQTSEVRKCPKCGNDIGDWIFCNKCGTNVEEYKSSEQATSVQGSSDQATPFVNSAVNGTDFFSQYNPTSIDVDMGSNNSANTVGSSYENVPHVNHQNPPIQNTNVYSTKRESANNVSAKPTGNKKLIAIAASIIGVLVVSIIILVVALTSSKPKPIDSLSQANYDNSYSDSKIEDSNSNSNSRATESYILMPSCENRKYSTVKSELEGMGLKVNVTYEFNDDIEKDYVISQMDREGSQLRKGDYVSLIISKGSDKCPYDYEQKLTVTASSGSSYATAELYEWQNGEWTKLATYDATVGSNGIGNTREGSSTSPKGIHKLGVVLSSSSVSTNLNTYRATSNTCVIDDTGSSYYNQIMEKNNVPSNTHYDNIGRGLTNGTTYATIYIEHNGSGFSSTNVVSGNGSAIGLRGQNGSLSPTYGDVDISASNMRDLLSKLDAYKNPVIELKTK